MKQKSSRAHIGSHIDDTKQDISLSKLVYYNLIFFIPIALSLIISVFIGRKISDYMETSVQITVQILMFFFTFLIFAFLIPYIRKRENVAGIRFALLAILLVGIVMTLPALFRGFWGLLLNQLTYLSSYLLLTFIYVPEALGITSNIEQWFKEHRQLLVILVYVSIILLYIAGFAYNYYEIELSNPGSFYISENIQPTYLSFFYFSTISFGTVGYGDITPISNAAQFITTLETVLALIINVVFIAILIAYISGFQSRAQMREEKEIRGFEAREKKDIRRLKEIEKVDISHLSSKERNDFKKLLTKIKKKPKKRK